MREQEKMLGSFAMLFFGMKYVFSFWIVNPNASAGMMQKHAHSH